MVHDEEEAMGEGRMGDCSCLCMCSYAMARTYLCVCVCSLFNPLEWCNAVGF